MKRRDSIAGDRTEPWGGPVAVAAACITFLLVACETPPRPERLLQQAAVGTPREGPAGDR